jgi:glycosyltransferase involved in cell wall biosynthesis
LLRVLLDATAVPADRRGVGRYVDSLIPALVKAAVTVLAVCQPRDRDHYGELTGRDPIVGPAALSRRPVRLAWEQTGLPARARKVRPDVLHSPHYTHPVVGRAPLVVTLHDATFFSDPDVHTRVKGPFFRTASRLALRRADVCVVDSQASIDELIAHAGADPGKLQLAHLGVDHTLFAPPDAPATLRVRRSLGLTADEPYIAFLGTMEPRKNIPALIRGWVQACQGQPDAPPLVLAGGTGWDTELEGAVAAVPSGLRLIRPGYLPLEDLPAFLGGATVVAYPSLGEGFGLPVLEAMACGAPVLTTTRLSLAEVGGDAVAYTEVDDASIGVALKSLVADPNRRKELAAAGQRRAAGFTWEACAQNHLTAYRRAIERAGQR